MTVKTKSVKSSKKVPTMADLLASQKVKSKRFNLKEKVEGVVVEKLPNALVLDIGGKSEGLVAERAFNEAKNFIRNLKVGDRVTGRVIVSENPEGYTIISLRDAAKDFFWKKLEKLKKEKEEMLVKVKNINPSGIVVDIFGLSGFIPTSHLGKDKLKNLAKLTGTSFKVKIIELNKGEDKIVLSEKEVSEKELLQAQKEVIKTIKVGKIYEGEITTLANFGVFVKIKPEYKKEKVEIEGLVHISELAWEKVDKPQDIYTLGQKVKVKVIEVKDLSVQSGVKLSLSIKQAKEDPWEKIDKKFKAEMRVKGVVSKKSDFGVFVFLEPGIEGLLHITKIPPGIKLHKGDNINVYIEEVNKKEKRISLGLVLTEKPVGYK